MSMMMQCSGKDATEYCNCSVKEHLINKYLNQPVLQCNYRNPYHATAGALNIADLNSSINPGSNSSLTRSPDCLMSSYGARE